MTVLQAHPDRAVVHHHHGGIRHIRLRIQAPALEGARLRSPMNLAFVLDRSGSMGGDRIALARGATLEALDRLTDTDRFAVVSYSGSVTVDVPSSPASLALRGQARARVGQIQADGSTDLAAGWLTGCREVAQSLEPGQVARCLLFTDGQANQGETRPDVLAAHAAALRARGVATSTFGIGLGFDEVLLQRIADQGGGNARFIESSADFRRLVDAELRDTLDVVLKGTVLRITVPPDGTVEAIGPWSLRQQGRDWDLSLGDLSSEETLELVLRVFVPGGALGSETTFGLSLFDQTGELEGGAATVSFRREVHAVNIAQPRDREVDQLVAERHAARTRAEAVRLNRQGDFAGAERMLNAVADRIARYAGDNPVLVSLIEALRAEATEHARPMTEVRSKRQWQKSSSELRGKDAEGTSKRRRD
jgi:Ca-activated chloride channel family protein